jgi:hypothetical protein
VSSTIALALALGALLAAGPALAQVDGADASAPPLPAGHPPLETAPTNAGPLPAGHPPLDDHAPSQPGAPGICSMPGFRQVPIPESFANEAADLPAGVVLVRVVDAQGAPIPNATVRMGSLREGERQEAVELPTRWDGVAQFEHVETGSNVSYRASVDYNGARSASAPFQLPTNAGYRVQLVRFDTDADARAVLIAEARVEISFSDDRLVVVERVNIVNFSNMSLSGQAPHPVAFVPQGGLRFRIPPGVNGFRVDEQSMGDQHVTEENGMAVMRGSIPPTGAQGSIPIVFQYRAKITGSEMSLDLSMPLPVLRATVVAQAPEGMRLDVEGMAPSEQRMHQGQRVLITGRERMRRDEPPIDTIAVQLSNIPASAGPERALSAVLAGFIALSAVVVGATHRKRNGGRATRDAAALESERMRWLAEATALHRAHERGEVGAETFARRKREIAFALASVLQRLAQTKSSRKD